MLCPRGGQWGWERAVAGRLRSGTGLGDGKPAVPLLPSLQGCGLGV